MKIYAVYVGRYWDGLTILNPLYSTKSNAITRALKEIEKIDNELKEEIEKYSSRTKTFVPMEISKYSRDAWSNGTKEVEIIEFTLE